MKKYLLIIFEVDLKCVRKLDSLVSGREQELNSTTLLRYVPIVILSIRKVFHVIGGMTQ